MKKAEIEVEVSYKCPYCKNIIHLPTYDAYDYDGLDVECKYCKKIIKLFM